MENKSKRLAKNTLLLTIRMIFLMLINLYTSRVLLNALGVEDYGIYNVVGGVVSMFSIISGSITAAITRFITFELGKGDKKRLGKVFSSAVIIQLFLALIVLLFIETIGLWFLNTKMLIPESRMVAANWVYQLSILTFVINLISVPYNAAIIAHEKMSAFAYIGLYEGIAKLVIASVIVFSPIDTLVFYALLLCLLSISVRVIYTLYCKKHFEECLLSWSLDYSLAREMFGFAGWNFIGASSGILRDQGGNIVINMFCGPIANAARGIAYQVNAAVQGFLNSFTTAMHPQITKSYASGEKQYFMSLLYRGSKVSYLILFVISLPIILSTDFIINLWLGQNPEYTSSFVALVLILTMSESISTPLITAMLATGDIKKYQIIVGGLNMLNLPISYVCLRIGMEPEVVFIIAIIISQLCLYARLVLLKSMINLDIIHFFKDVYFRLIMVSISSFIVSFAFTGYVENDFLGFLQTTIVSLLCSITSIWFLGLNKVEKNIVTGIIKKNILRFIYKKNNGI